MNEFLTSVILSALLGAPTDVGFTESVDVYRCDFEHHDDQPELESDINYDGWPDRWTRRTGRGYPRYLGMSIKPDPTDGANSCLMVELNGGAAEAYSPPADVSSLFSYRLKGRLNLDGLKHDSAYFSITLFDLDGEPIESYFSKRHTKTNGWVSIAIGPLTPSDPDVRYAKIGIHVQPGEKADIWGRAAFDDIQLMRLPRMQLQANKPFHYFEDASEVEITCEISGIHKSSPTVEFELIDINGETVQRELFPLQLVELRQVTSRKSAAANPGRGRNTQAAPVDIRRGYESKQSWRPTIPNGRLGYYEVRASIRDGERLVLKRSISLALGRQFKPRATGRYGWSIASLHGTISLRELAQLTKLAGVHWIKLPIWFGEEGDNVADEIAWFAERMSASGVSLVGVLDKPPVALGSGTGAIEHPPVALVFDEEDVWKPLINPVMTRLSLKMRYWQLGADDDQSYVGFGDLPQRIGTIKQYLERFGQEVRLGFSWPWIQELPNGVKAPWSFVSLTSETPLTHAELQEALTGDSVEQAGQRWALIRTLDPDRYPVDVRARDLVLRMLEAKINGAGAIFAADPFHPKYGLMQPDGSPNMMLLPWRTTTHMTAGSEFVGSVQMPRGSRNFVFSHDSQGVMVVWNDTPTEEVLYLGDNVVAYDVWGRIIDLEERESPDGFRRQVVRAAVSPTFISGINLPVAKWRMGFKFDKERLASSSGQSQRVAYRVANAFPRSVSASAKVRIPDLWESDQVETSFDLNESESRQVALDVKLGSYAPSGPQPIRIDFQVTTDHAYRFSVYRSLEVGLGDLQIEVDTELDPRTGNLLVHVHLDNKTDGRARFNCLMFAKDRRRKRLRLSSSGRGRTSSTFIAESGAELIGETIFIQAREVSGGRTLNYRLIAEE